MCGPADFEALQLCMTRLSALAGVGLSAYAAHRAATLAREIRADRAERRRAGLAPDEPTLENAGAAGR
jgi:hypothetical protein